MYAPTFAGCTYHQITAIPYDAGPTYSDVACVLVQDTTLLTNLALARCFPFLPAASLFLLVHKPVDLAVVRIDDDLVAVLDERNGAPVDRLRDDMSDDVSTGRAGEAAVGNKCCLATEARTHEGTRRAQHLGHARRTLGTHVPEDDDSAFCDFASGKCGVEVVEAVEDLRLTLEAVALLARELRDGGVGSEVAAEDGQVAGLAVA